MSFNSRNPSRQVAVVFKKSLNEQQVDLPRGIARRYKEIVEGGKFGATDPTMFSAVMLLSVFSNQHIQCDLVLRCCPVAFVSNCWRARITRQTLVC